MKFTVPGQPVPKPRMTRRDKWRRPPRPCVARYQEYKTRIVDAWARAGAIRFKVIVLSARFYVHGRHDVDLDNLMKALCDSLQGWVVPKDTIDYIPGFDRPWAERVKRPEEARTEIMICEAQTL